MPGGGWWLLMESFIMRAQIQLIKAGAKEAYVRSVDHLCTGGVLESAWLRVSKFRI